MSAVLALAVGAVRRRRLQGVVTGIVMLLASATTVLALALLLASDGPFEQAFERQHGAHATTVLDRTQVTPAEVAATASATAVSASAGPHSTAEVALRVDGGPSPTVTVAGREQATPGVDDLELVEGEWLTGPGQVVLSAGFPGGSAAPTVGDTVTLDLPGSPELTVVGVASSVTRSADAWVWPTEEFLTGDYQMLYRFAAFEADPFGADAQEAAVDAAVAAATQTLPDDALAGSSTYLAVQRSSSGTVGALVPFVVAFAALGLAMSVLVVANVVAGAVVAGRRATGIQRAVGLSPAQVVSVIVVRMLLVAVPACLAGVALGAVAAVPLLGTTASAYAVDGTVELPALAPLATVVVVLLVVTVAALVPAVRAGRLPPVRALAIGRAPVPGRPSRLRRAVASLPLPRPVALGLTSMFARPARSTSTLVALVFGATTAVLAVGLSSSLSAFVAASDRTAGHPVEVTLADGVRAAGVPAAGTASGPPAQEEVESIAATILDEPGTAGVVGVTTVPATLVGSTEPVGVRAYDGDPSWTGYPMLSGRWFAADDEVVASSRMLRLTGTHVGDVITLAGPVGSTRVRVVGEVFANDTGGGSTLLMSTSAVAPLAGDVRLQAFEVGLVAGTDPQAYVASLTATMPENLARPVVVAQEQENSSVAIMTGLVAVLAVALCAVAALGVLNSVVLTTREQVQEIGVLKAIGMTPRQVRTMVVVSTVLVGLAAGLLAVPLGTALHATVLPAMGDAAQSRLPASVLDVYHARELVVLAASGVALAVLGALLPAGWAARTTAAAALRAE